MCNLIVYVIWLFIHHAYSDCVSRIFTVSMCDFRWGWKEIKSLIFSLGNTGRSLERCELPQSLDCRSEVLRILRHYTGRLKVKDITPSSAWIAIDPLNVIVDRLPCSITVFFFQALDTKTTQLYQKQINGLALHLIFHRFSPFNCCLSVVW